MASSLKLEIITPSRVLDRFEAKAVTVPGAKGYITILPGHAAMVSEIATGELAAVDTAGTRHSFFVSGGYLECGNAHLTLLLEVAERPSEVDSERASIAKKKAMEELKSPKGDYLQAQEALKRAEGRLFIADQNKKA